MSERYSKLFTLPENLYATGSPVVIAAGALLKDNQTGKVLAQLKLRNIGKKTIKAATVCVEPLDTVGQPLGEPVTYQYLDLHADRDADFGQKAPVALPDSATRSFDVSVVQVIFTDNVIWNADSEEWKPLNRPQPLDALGDSELAKQFRIEYGGGCENLLLEQKDLWYCVCGGVNRQEEGNCHKCGKALSELQAIDMDNLRKAKEERVTKEKEKAEAAQSKAKKNAKILAFSTCCIAVLAVAAIIISGMVKKSNDYNTAIAYVDEGAYDKAIALFVALDDYKDSAEWIQKANNEKLYSQAVTSLECGDFDDAISGFSDLGEYRDSAEKLEEAQMGKKYQYAISLLDSNATQEDAYYIFLELSDYKDAMTYADDFLLLPVLKTYSSYIHELKYDTYGRIIQDEFANTSPAFHGKWVYAYNPDGSFVCTYYVDDEASSRTNYNKFGDEEKYYSYYAEGGQEYKWSYSDDGSQKTKTWLSSGKEVTYDVDNHNNITYDGWKKYKYTYDSNEQIVRKETYENDLLIEKTEYSYVYAYLYCPDAK